ncbi:MAG: hypothetical protein A2Y62_15890 [Candidatus Fischerbacteria bacterium RBG_13_37_8]|uniref:Uncharacterized protein n=1 Tax=Candidatus Fischerbacteria bacterium RBG_13_37_8 TaxID=1817863 RepID=A0A1F5VSG9_9BACT|nr:MAG: hypothetical protein A2Y62_15890 [Candidatus Fischerbacteria bacterium RBG_13_37_8]
MELFFLSSNLLGIQFFGRFFIIGLAISIIGLIFFLRYIIVSLTISVQRILHPLPWYSESLAKKYLLALLFLVISLIGLAWMYTGYLLQNYQPVEKAVIAGIVEVQKEKEGEFIVKFISSYDNFPEQNISKGLQGDQWALGGVFLDFPSFLKYMGLNSCHQPIDFVAKDLKVMYRPDLEYMEMLSRKPDLLWSTIFKIQSILKFNVAEFRLTPFHKAKTGNYEIYAGKSGYIIQMVGKKVQ